MRGKKTYIILIVILLIFFVVMFLLFGLDNVRKEKYETTLIVGNDTVWVSKKKKWANLYKYDKLNWEKYNIYINNEKLGKYYLWRSDKWYAFDNKKDAVLLDGDLIAYKSNHDISIYSYTQEEIDNFDYVYEVLEENGISTNSEYTSKYKVVFDFDNDGYEEDFYLISNAFPMDFNPEKIFSIVFMVKNDTIYPIYTDVSNNASFNGCKPYFNTFIDIDSDNNYEIILSCGRYSVSNTTNMLYQFEKDKFKILISNNK